MQEYWVNVYQYPSLPGIVFYSHNIFTKKDAIRYGIGRKSVLKYRIHVKVKPKIGDNPYRRIIRNGRMMKEFIKNF